MNTHICNNKDKCSRFNKCYHGKKHSPIATQESINKVKLYATFFRNINSEICNLKKRKCTFTNFKNTICNEVT